MINNICLSIIAIAVLVILTIIHRNVLKLIEKVYKLNNDLYKLGYVKQDITALHNEVFNLRNECSDINTNIKQETIRVNNVNCTTQTRITTILEHIDIIESNLQGLQDTKKSKMDNRKPKTFKEATQPKIANKGKVDSISKVQKHIIDK